MKIENIRVGFATNSSSSHAIMFGIDHSSRDWEDGNFGWNEFICNCRDSKLRYLAETLYANLRDLGDSMASAVVRDWTLGTFSAGKDYDGGVDHQSLMSLPISMETRQVDKQFFEELTAYYLRDNLAIVGGNDNDDSCAVDGAHLPHILETDQMLRRQVCRRDEVTGHWVLFNKHSGAKIRLHFCDDAAPYVKSSAPELVDVKITDYCPKGCKFCYQGSITAGKHCSMDTIQSVIWRLSDMSVFEVAIGGGEPTEHPNFVDILNKVARYGIVPNFSSGTTDWMADPKIAQTIRDVVGRFAISVQCPEDVKRAQELFKTHIAGEKDYHPHKMSFQYVMGSTTLDVMKNIIIEAANGSFDVTLLGWKSRGRATNEQPIAYDAWLEVVKSLRKLYVRIGIDTSLAADYRDEVLAAVDDRLVTFEEGKFSMYVDAVSESIGPSSYDDEHLISMSDCRGRDWKKLFSEW